MIYCLLKFQIYRSLISDFMEMAVGRIQDLLIEALVMSGIRPVGGLLVPELVSAKVALRLIYCTLALAIAVLLPFSAIRVDFVDVASMAWINSILVILAICCRAGKAQKLEMFCECVFVVISGMFLCMILSYVTASFSGPLIDDLLWSLDRAVGFDWPVVVRLLDSSALTIKVLTYAYGSMIFQLLLIPLVLIIMKQPARAYVALASFLSLTIVACAMFIWTPAQGAFPTSGLQPHEIVHANMKTASFAPDLQAVREAAVYSLQLGHLSGLVSMPSVHAGTAPICAWATWRLPVFKYVIGVLNILMSIAAIILGGHYLVDILAGWAVAALMIYGVLHFCQWYETAKVSRREADIVGEGQALV